MKNDFLLPFSKKMSSRAERVPRFYGRDRSLTLLLPRLASGIGGVTY